MENKYFRRNNYNTKQEYQDREIGELDEEPIIRLQDAPIRTIKLKLIRKGKQPLNLSELYREN